MLIHWSYIMQYLSHLIYNKLFCSFYWQTINKFNINLKLVEKNHCVYGTLYIIFTGNRFITKKSKSSFSTKVLHAQILHFVRPDTKQKWYQFSLQNMDQKIFPSIKGIFRHFYKKIVRIKNSKVCYNISQLVK